jgi:hypothetical protein
MLLAADSGNLPGSNAFCSVDIQCILSQYRSDQKLCAPVAAIASKASSRQNSTAAK